MKKSLIFAGMFFLLSGYALAQEDKVAPLETEMGAGVYLCGLNFQLADATKGPKKQALLDEAGSCAANSKEKIKSLVKAEYAKYPEGDAVRERIKSLYAAYLTYLSSAMWGKDLNESKEALAFKERVSDYRAEIELR
ncbi:hypothetical protein [Pseudomonas fluorescens]